MTKTLKKKLERYEQLVRANEDGRSRYYNPNRHPLPTLPDQTALEVWYWNCIVVSEPPIIAEKIKELISFVEEHRASHKYKEA